MKVQVIVGSTRPGRISDRVAKWVVKSMGTMDSMDVELVDLAEYNLPFFDEAISPQYNPERKPDELVKRFLDKLAEADAYVLVTPEYSRSTSGVLKNALDFIDYQLAKKPVALVAHGATGGAQAVSHLRGIVPGLLAVTIPAATYITDRAAVIIDENGTLSDEAAQRPHGPQTALQRTLDELKWYGEALATARTKA